MMTVCLINEGLTKTNVAVFYIVIPLKMNLWKTLKVPTLMNPKYHFNLIPDKCDFGSTCGRLMWCVIYSSSSS